MRPLLRELASAYGIDIEYWDWKGQYVEVSEDTVISVLAAMDIDVSTEEAITKAIEYARFRSWYRVLPAIVVTEAGQAKTIEVHVPAGTSVQVEVQQESGEIVSLAQIDNWEPDRWIGEEYLGEASFVVPETLPIGYHRIVAHLESGRKVETLLVVSPHFLGFPKSMGDKRVWGYATQLYSISSQESWGIGDFSDLADLATWSKTQQYADFLLVNPLHAGEPKPRIEPSPYLPMSRRYLNPLYLRPEDIAEYAVLSDAQRAEIKNLWVNLKTELSASELILRDPIWAAKMAALQIIYQAGRTEAREMEFEAYLKAEGAALSRFATWCALVLHYGMDWRSWPAALQRPSAPETSAFSEQHAEEVRFFAWLQWCAKEQLAAAQRQAKNVGMRIGIMNDLAVGVSQNSAEAWALGEVFAQGCSVGAPPDHFNQTGQDWGQLPWRPDRLEDLAYAPFREMVAGALRHSGGLRVDHVMGLFRLWWIPEGKTPSQGTYIRYNHEAMVGILALEAYRVGALVVGEDLGVVEPWVRSYLRDRGILGTSIAWFEMQDDGWPKDPSVWREYCLASVTTHDLPPTAGYLLAKHIELQSRLGLLTEDEATELRIFHEFIARWLEVLRGRQLLSTEITMANLEENLEEVMLAMHKFLVATPARVLCASLSDAVGDFRTQNQPGTIDEYPNWRVKLSNPKGEPVLLRNLYHNERAARLAAVMNDWGN